MQPVTCVAALDGLRDYKCYKTNVATATGLAAILGEALQTTCEAIIINNQSGGTVYYQVDGTLASATNGCEIASGQSYMIVGKRQCAAASLYAASTLAVSFVQKTL